MDYISIEIDDFFSKMGTEVNKGSVTTDRLHVRTPDTYVKDGSYKEKNNHCL